MADRVVWNPGALAALARDERLRESLDSVGRRVAGTARAGAPHRTGAGAGSIRQETTLSTAGWEARVSWDQLHRYMRFQDLGSRSIRGSHFLEHALDRYARP